MMLVALRHRFECEGKVLPEGARGTVVHAYRDGEHYEVEFFDTFPCVVAVERDDIRCLGIVQDFDE